jgi:hypothetical protein
VWDRASATKYLYFVKVGAETPPQRQNASKVRILRRWDTFWTLKITTFTPFQDLAWL